MRLPVAMMPSTCLSSMASTWIWPRRGIVLDVAQEHRDAVVDQRFGDAGHHRQREAAIGIVGQQADGEAAPAQQALRQAVGAEAESLRRPAGCARASPPSCAPCSFSAFEAVAVLTPAAGATSRSVTGAQEDGVLLVVGHHVRTTEFSFEKTFAQNAQKKSPTGKMVDLAFRDGGEKVFSEGELGEGCGDGKWANGGA